MYYAVFGHLQISRTSRLRFDGFGECVELQTIIISICNIQIDFILSRICSQRYYLFKVWRQIVVSVPTLYYVV